MNGKYYKHNAKTTGVSVNSKQNVDVTFPGVLCMSPVDAGDLVWLLGQDNPLEEGMATHSNILALRISWQTRVHGIAKSQIKLNNFHFTSQSLCKFSPN